MSDLPFGPDAVAAITAHMNGDHAADNVLICRGLGAVAATEAVNTGLDAEALIFTATVDGEQVEVRIPWSAPLTDRAQVRREVVRMYEESCALVGEQPRAH